MRTMLADARALAAAPHTFPAEIGWRAGGLARFRVLHRRFVSITDADLAREVLVTQHSNFVRTRLYRNAAAVVGDGLLTTDGPLWLSRRRAVLPAFRPDRLRQVADTTASGTAAMLTRWEAERQRGRAVDAVAEAQRLSLGIIGDALLSTGFDGEQAATFAAATCTGLQLVRRRNTAVVPLPPWLTPRSERKLRTIRTSLDRFIDRCADARGAKDDILAYLHGPLAGLSPTAARDEAKTLFVAGFETTATALAWALHLLAGCPESAEACARETADAVGDGPPALKDLPRLPTALAIAKETMRLYPPAYAVSRRAVADATVRGHAITGGTMVLISVLGIHRSAAHWEAPEAFRPERFLGAGPPVPHAFLPFATGKHTCIGNNFALAELTVAIAMITRRYRLERAYAGPVGSVARITLAPDRPLPLHLHARA